MFIDKWKNRTLVGPTIIASLVLSSGATATADAVDPADQSKKVQAALVTKSYNIEVANAHGYKIVLVDGKQTSVKVSDQPIKQDGIKPYQDDPQVIAAGGEPVVGGSCGVSFLYYTAKGNRKADVYTGFDVWPAPAIEFYWEVSVTDSIGTGVGTWGYPVNNWNWETYWETSHGPTGYSLAKVSGGWALLANGQVCYSGGPWQDTNLY